MHNESKVRLPEKFWEQAQDQQELKQMIIDYLRVGYPGYTVRKVKGRIAICEISR
ncbi:hypothetical protein [Virgibacillus halodenitrificans]|uniref:hypothetical protein n=1 Tax=Virgibacillus halodenitrificans TaxID=1482 RepID=UPI00031CADB3|nr:hypothetical protein [Virgibacillus halodenitrificans]